MNGELTDDQREEVKDGVEGEAVLENRTTEEDVEMEEEEESIEAEVCGSIPQED